MQMFWIYRNNEFRIFAPVNSEFAEEDKAMNEEFNPKNAADEEWTMPEPNKNLPPNQRLIEPIEDWSMTGKLVPPKPNGADDWQMPAPKFRVTSGSLPDDFIKKSSDNAEVETAPLNFDGKFDDPPVEEEFKEEFREEEVLPPTQTDAAVFETPLATPPIEEQPDVAEVFLPAPEVQTEKPPEKKPRSNEMKIFLAILGLSAMFVFAAGFLIVIYFLFFYSKTAAP